jgi:signal transduction histidine kinase
MPHGDVVGGPMTDVVAERADDLAQDRLLAVLEPLQALPTDDLEVALTAACGHIAAAFGADKSDAFLLAPDAATLVALGTSDTPMGRLQRALGLHILPLANGGRAAEVFQTGRPHRDGRVDLDPEELRGIKEALGIRSAITAPLLVAGERRGVLQVDSARPDFFTREDLRRLEVVARWIGLLAERAGRARASAAEERMTVLAHDLRNLLAPLSGRLQLLRRRAEREGRSRDREDSAAALQGLARLERLIADLLDSQRLEAGIFALEPAPTDLAALVRETVAAAGGDTVPVEVAAPGELVVRADPARLRQALENLLGNAVKHSPPGVPVTVALAIEEREGQRWAVVTVADRGPGIASALLPRLFDRFVKGDGSGGLGLGLYLARGIAAAHGGTLDAESTPCQGARFRLALPVEDPARATGAGPVTL